MKIAVLETQRLILRQWRDDDFPIFARMNANPSVMEFYPAVLSSEESDTMAAHLRDFITTNGWGLWAVELKSDASFIGFVGLYKTRHKLPVPECVEVGWRLAKSYWGSGFASEAASVSLQYAFDVLNLSAVCSYTSVINERSQRVMQRIGMQNMQTNFQHPIVPADSPLSEHVYYKITKTQWLTAHKPR